MGQNTTGIEQKVENIIKTLSKRKLTLPGNITILLKIIEGPILSIITLMHFVLNVF